jgi:hypothetical protein
MRIKSWALRKLLFCKRFPKLFAKQLQLLIGIKRGALRFFLSESCLDIVYVLLGGEIFLNVYFSPMGHIPAMKKTLRYLTPLTFNVRKYYRRPN